MTRTPEHPIEALFLKRRSSRALSDDVSNETLMSLFEAAKWAPSSKNDQPWRFIYAKKHTPSWDKLFNLLAEGNKRWCANAAVLVVIVSRNHHADGTENRSHSFSAGSAYENMALQAAALGMVAHAMGGFDKERARTELAVPESYSVDVMVAIGIQADIAHLNEQDRAREAPSQRKQVSELLMEGKFKPDLA